MSWIPVSSLELSIIEAEIVKLEVELWRLHLLTREEHEKLTELWGKKIDLLNGRK